jgi:hypothetical protein
VQRDAFYRALALYPAPMAPAHWSQRGDGEIDAPVPLKVDPLVTDGGRIDLADRDLYSWDLAGIDPETLMRGNSASKSNESSP